VLEVVCRAVLALEVVCNTVLLETMDDAFDDVIM
jgi:hypothetical protein